MMEEIQKLIALQQSGAMDEKSLVLSFLLDNRDAHSFSIERHGKVCTVWTDGLPDLPQSFFRDKELIEAVQEAQVDGVDEKNAADKIRNVMARSGVILRARYVREHGRFVEKPPQPVKDADLIWAFEVVEVAGPVMVVPRGLEDDGYTISHGWKVVSLRRALVRFMDLMNDVLAWSTRRYVTTEEDELGWTDARPSRHTGE